MITVWGAGTSRTLRAIWALEELGLPYDVRMFGSRSGVTQSDTFRTLNPKEKIPVLVDGQLVLTESGAIVTYLADTYGRDTTLAPEPYTVDRARYNEWLAFVMMELDAHTLYVVRKHRDLADVYGEAPNAVQTAIDGFHKQARVAVARLTSRRYLLGGAFSGADLMLATCLEWAHAYGLDLDPALDDYRRRIRQRPAFAAAASRNFQIRPDQSLLED